MDIDFDLVYKGVYIIRLITFLITFFTFIAVYLYVTNENVLDGIIISVGLLLFIIISGKIGEYILGKRIHP